MSDWEKVRERNKTLLIVEGHHEKYRLFSALIRCYPEMNMAEDRIILYGTNIYILVQAIMKEYGTDWTDMDVDLPYLVSSTNNRYNRRDFSNIYLVFDYERHDPNFSETVIVKLLRYFCDASDMGQLYINYPMVESYAHLYALPDLGYEERKIPVTLRPGKRYKTLVQDTVVTKAVGFSHKLEQTLLEDYHLPDHLLTDCMDALLAINSPWNIEERIRSIVATILSVEEVERAVRHFRALFLRAGYLSESEDYWGYLRHVFSEVILHNIYKAYRIQTGDHVECYNAAAQCFAGLSDVDILMKQNQLSQDAATGFIWVLNTCVFLVAEYNFALLDIE